MDWEIRVVFAEKLMLPLKNFVGCCVYTPMMRFSIFWSVLSVLVTVLAVPLEALAQSSEDRQVLLQTEGVLENGDLVLESDGSLYDEYSFAGQAGQAVILKAESDEFNTYLWLLDENGQAIAENDDWNDSRNSTIGYVFPTDGAYSVRVNAYDAQDRGSYQISVSTTITDDPVIIKFQAGQLLQQGFELYLIDNQFQESLTTWQIALEMYQEIGDKTGEGVTLSSLGMAYLALDDYRQALNFSEQSLEILQNIEGKPGEGFALISVGSAHLFTHNTQQSIERCDQALDIAHELNNKHAEKIILQLLGLAYNVLGYYRQAIELYERSQSITIDTENPVVQENLIAIFNNITQILPLSGFSWSYYSLGQPQKAIEFSEQQLKLSRTNEDKLGEADALNSLGVIYYNLDEYQKAIDLHKESLKISETIGNLSGVGYSLGNLGLIYLSLDDYQRALDFHSQSLEIARETGEKSLEAFALDNIGDVYHSLDEYQKALGFQQQSLIVSREIGELPHEIDALRGIGNIYYSLGQYQKTLEFYQKALEIAQDIGERSTEGRILRSLGNTYHALDQYQKSIELYQEALEIAQDTGARSLEGSALRGLGNVSNTLRQYQKSLEFYQEALEIAQDIGDRSQTSFSRSGLGNAYYNLGQYQRAIELYQQRLITAREIGDRASESSGLASLGFVFKNRESPEAAIAFYYQSLNTRANIGQALEDPIARQSYLETVSQSWRNLRQLLLEQGRNLEAQLVAELFKAQELSDYASDKQITTEMPEIPLLPEENATIAAYDELLALTQQMDACEIDNCSNMNELTTLKQQAEQNYQLTVENLTAFIQKDGYKGHPQLRDNYFLRQAESVVDSQANSVLIYPTVLEDTLWLLWVTKNGVRSQQIQGVNQQELTETISAFRTGLETRYSDLTELQANANQLYNWLIAPVEEALGDSVDVESLVLALDRNTRYVPIAALHDGQKYLIEKYNISTILAASLTNTDERAPMGKDGISILAAGTSARFENFPALPNVPIELDTIVKEQNNPNDQVGIYSGQQLLDPDFTAQTLRNSLSENTQFLHIATHGEFVPGNRYSSYLLMGNGEKLPLPEIAELGSALRGVHLAVLSACQTALGGADEEGLEIAGLGYYFFKNEVDAVMASLWNVNDASTSQLMQTSYQTLSEGTEANPITKAEALRMAQLSLLQANASSNSDTDRFRRIPKNPNDQVHPESVLAHPYYWAPFILIGNGL